MSKKIRVRFAPSPTGPLHIGGVRTALFNYLFAKKHNGCFILRIEDTDRNRYVEGAEAYIIEALNWCGIPFDEGPGKEKDGYGPYRQSERKHLYKRYADELVAKGKAYYAFDTAGELDALRKAYEAKGETFIYNRHNRMNLKNSLSLPDDEVKRRIAAGEDYAIRFNIPQDETLLLKDIIRGEMAIDTNVLDDKVLFKSDGMPTYHLANVVDDHLMTISHVIRGEEWLPSLALHNLLYDAFGWEKPEFAHLPLILKPSGNGKLSKRDGDKLGFPVFPLEWKDRETGLVSPGYRETGYFPEAVINFLALLGWNPGTEQELFSLEELVSAFALEKVNKSGARFDPEKIKWFNHHYLQTKSSEELAALFFGQRDNAYVTRVIGLLKERATFVRDFWLLGDYFFKAPLSYNEKAAEKHWKPETGALMEQLTSILNALQDFSAGTVETVVKGWISDTGLGPGQVMPPLRLALAGDMTGPDLFAIAALLGKSETINRIKKAVAALGNKN
ncbi:MAG: glutamate--tRNA ligase [Sinomicrobium sp.]|nr:glutamate--tRNA ligase [Sinomicrobium sp.]